MDRLVRRSLLVLFVAALASPALAQRAAGPYEGVLSSTDDANARHVLTLRTSFYSVWDKVDPEFDEELLQGGLAGGAGVGLTHARRSSRTQWESSASSEMRVYGSSSDVGDATFTGRSGLNSNLTSRVSTSLTGGWAYSPFYDLSPTYGNQFQTVGSSGGGFGGATVPERNTNADGTAGITVRFSQRDTFDVSGYGRRWIFLDTPERSVTSYGGNATYRHALTRALGVHAGFGREEADYDYEGAGQAATSTIDVGVDYGDTLEFSRRTALSFEASTSFVQWNDDTHFRVNGSAALTQAFGRTGSGVLQYRRTTEFAAGFREPLLTDSLTFGVSNQIGRQAAWSTRAGYEHGVVGFEANANRYHVVDAGGRLTRAVTRHLGVFGDYSYYRYEVPNGVTVPTSVPKFSRHSVSGGITLWTPLINDTRPPAGTR